MVSCIGEVEVQGGTKPPGMVEAGVGETVNSNWWYLGV